MFTQWCIGSAQSQMLRQWIAKRNGNGDSEEEERLGKIPEHLDGFPAAQTVDQVESSASGVGPLFLVDRYHTVVSSAFTV